MIRFLLIFILISCAHKKNVSKSDAKYKRGDWEHWSDDDHNCLNTRQEILKARSHVAVTMNKKGCKVVTGMWDDYYYPEVHTQSKKVDIDHLIPLKYAHMHGAQGWSHEHKEKFANDPENLVITNKSYNRKKGAKGIDQWLPAHKEYACKYIHDWMKIKSKYNLIVTEKEKNTIQQIACPN